jgi:hypothetical protein
MIPYWIKLQHPLWQKRRLEILQKSDFKCRECGSGNHSLHVHHVYYEKGKEPWDYPDEALISLCQVCHNNRAITEHRLLAALSCVDEATLRDFVEAFEGGDQETRSGWLFEAGFMDGFMNYCFDTGRGFTIRVTVRNKEEEDEFNRICEQIKAKRSARENQSTNENAIKEN